MPYKDLLLCFDVLSIFSIKFLDQSEQWIENYSNLEEREKIKKWIEKYKNSLLDSLSS